MKAETESYKKLFFDQEYHSLYTNLAMIGAPSILVRTLELYGDLQDTKQLRDQFIESNPFHYSTKASRKRHFTSIKNLLLETFTNSHRKLLLEVAESGLNRNFYKLVLYLQVGLNSKLFREMVVA